MNSYYNLLLFMLHVGMNILVTSTIPESAGLSSSSALVCSAAMSNMHSNGFHLTKVCMYSVLVKQ